MSTTKKSVVLSYGNRNASGKVDDVIFKITSGSTIHSLREDGSKAFKKGTALMLYKVISDIKKEHCGVVKCTGYQTAILRGDGVNVTVTIDGKLLTGADMVRFYRNEGFNNLDDFLNWYVPRCKRSLNNTLTLKLVHWTDFRY